MYALSTLLRSSFAEQDAFATGGNGSVSLVLAWRGK